MEQTPLDNGLIRCTFDWSPKYGQCYDCGFPAAFALPLAYGESIYNFNAGNFTIEAHHKRCAVCAANAAAEGGETVVRIEDWEDNLR